jgi:hypothetical protein
MGARDARRWLRADPGPDDPWQVEPLDAFTRQEGSGRRATAPAKPRARAGRR